MSEATVSTRAVLVGALPSLLREGALPLLAYWAASELAGFVAGVACAATCSLGVYLFERRAGREGLLARISLATVTVQAAVGLLTDNERLYLAQPVLITAAWALAFFASIPIKRPLAGAMARSLYPFSAELRAAPEFRRTFTIESAVWGVYFLARSALRLFALFHGGVGGLVLATALTGTPCIVALLAWSVHFAGQRLDNVTEPGAGSPSQSRRCAGSRFGRAAARGGPARTR